MMTAFETSSQILPNRTPRRLSTLLRGRYCILLKKGWGWALSEVDAIPSN